jgi:phage tail P2-like protein
MSSTLRKSKLVDLCTPSISYDRQVQSGCAAFDNQMYEIIDATGVVVMIPNIMGLTDSNLVNILAWQFHVDFYDASKPLEFRKNLVQQAISWHKRKGTVALVQEVLDTYWPGGATLLEWYAYYNPLPPNYPTAPGWHDRYRFRVYVDEQIIQPADEAAVLTLIEHYKPISRWCEGIFRAETSECDIGWYGMLLRFIYRESEPPDRTIEAETYHLAAPPDASGPVAVHSDLFTVALPTLSTVDAIVTVTPDDGGQGGTFIPASAKLSNANPVAQFAYMPASAGDKTISVTNDSGLADPPAVNYHAKVVAVTYTLIGPAAGYIGVASTVFTVALPINTITSAPVTITPSDGGAGGTFTPASVQLDQTLRSLYDKAAGGSATFTYTPA